jgi:hypothetical protein
VLSQPGLYRETLCKKRKRKRKGRRERRREEGSEKRKKEEKEGRKEARKEGKKEGKRDLDKGTAYLKGYKLRQRNRAQMPLPSQ